MLRHLPNALTLLRLILAPVVAYAVWEARSAFLGSGDGPVLLGGPETGAEAWALFAAVLFVFAALTDLFDGMAARALKIDSKFGRMLDPIADKALVGLPLIAISVVAWKAGWSTWALVAGSTAIIVGRDLLITALRLVAPDGEGARVSRLAKWKTAVELIAVGAPIIFAAGPALARLAGASFGIGPEVTMVWTGLLMLAAGLSALTAVQYLTAKAV